MTYENVKRLKLSQCYCQQTNTMQIYAVITSLVLHTTCKVKMLISVNLVDQYTEKTKDNATICVTVIK